MNKQKHLVVSFIMLIVLTFLTVNNSTRFQYLDASIYQLNWEVSDSLITFIYGFSRTATLFPVVLFMLFIALGFLWKRGKVLAFWAISNVFVVSFLGLVFKYTIARGRPDVGQLIKKTDFSFPNSYVLVAMCLVCTLYLVLKKEDKSYTMIKSALILYPIAIAISQVFLRIAYPSDLIGGFLLSYVYVHASYALVMKIFYNQNKHSKPVHKQKVFLFIGSIAALLLLATSMYGVAAYKNLQKATDAMYQPLERESVPITNKSVKPVSFLLLGIANDSNRQNDYRANTIMVATVNNENEKTTITSIPRDAYVEIIGKNGLFDKINHAHSFGSEIMMIDTIESYFDIPINHYFSINMDGLADLVEAVGGVTVDNDFAFEAEGIFFPEGKNELNGWETLQYTRMRNEDPLGDYGRQKRQREVTELLIDKLFSLNSVVHYQELLNVIGDNGKTDMTLGQMTSFLKNYNGSLKSIETDQLQGIDFIGDGQTGQQGISYQLISDEEKQRAKDNFAEQLQVD